MPAHAVTHEVLNVGSRHAGNVARCCFAILQNRMRDIVPVAHAALVRMRRAHPVAAVVKETAGEYCSSMSTSFRTRHSSPNELRALVESSGYVGLFFCRV